MEIFDPDPQPEDLAARNSEIIRAKQTLKRLSKHHLINLFQSVHGRA
jgi:hypothetical protein